MNKINYNDLKDFQKFYKDTIENVSKSDKKYNEKIIKKFEEFESKSTNKHILFHIKKIKETNERCLRYNYLYSDLWDQLNENFRQEGMAMKIGNYVEYLLREIEYQGAYEEPYDNMSYYNKVDEVSNYFWEIYKKSEWGKNGKENEEEDNGEEGLIKAFTRFLEEREKEFPKKKLKRKSEIKEDNE